MLATEKCENPYMAVSVSVWPCCLCLLSILTNVLNRNDRRYLSGIYLYLYPRSQALPKPTFSQAVKEFLAFYGTRSFIAAFITARYLSLSKARSIQCTPPSTPLIFFLEEPINFYPHLKVSSIGRYEQEGVAVLTHVDRTLDGCLSVYDISGIWVKSFA